MGSIQNFKTLTVFGGSGIDCHSIFNNLVKYASSNTHCILFCSVSNNFRQTMDALLGHSRNINYRSILQEHQFFTQHFGIAQSGSVVFFVQVPFIYNKDNAFACFVSITNNLFILFSYAFNCVEYHQNNVATVNCTQGTHNAVFFDRFVNFRFTAHAGSIDEQIALTISGNRSIDSVTGSTCYITNDGAFFTNKSIEDGRFTNIRTTNQSNFDFVFVFRFTKGVFIAKFSNDCIKQIAQT